MMNKKNLSNKFCKFLLQNINNKNREICKESRIFFMEKFNPKDWKTKGFTGYCHFVVNIKTKEEVLIPICIGTAVSNDLDMCTCRSSFQWDKSKEKLIEENNHLKKILKENNIKF